jgi:TonB family protein
MLIALALVAQVTTASYEPPRLTRVAVDAVPFNTRAAGVVAFEAAVTATGTVGGVKTIKAVEPFTALIAGPLPSWGFEPARQGGQAAPTAVLVLGVFRPAMLLFPAPPSPDPRQYDLSPEVPRPVSWAIPPYPPNAIGSATVVVEVTVGDDGTVKDARVVTDRTGFDDAATSTARGWTFQPAQRGGRPASARVEMIFDFRAPQN